MVRKKEVNQDQAVTCCPSARPQFTLRRFTELHEEEKRREIEVTRRRNGGIKRGESNLTSNQFPMCSPQSHRTHSLHRTAQRCSRSYTEELELNLKGHTCQEITEVEENTDRPVWVMGIGVPCDSERAERYKKKQIEGQDSATG